jgi:hypothetical protein
MSEMYVNFTNNFERNTAREEPSVITTVARVAASYLLHLKILKRLSKTLNQIQLQITNLMES